MVTLEVIVSSLDDALVAAEGGADRFELCSALALGGLTPSLGTLAAIKGGTTVPVMFMVRPREGGMCYSAGEVAVMERDAALGLEARADGVVFGFLTADGDVDVARCRAFLRHCSGVAAGRQWVFHRAFDVVRDPAFALEQLIDLGITRVLTSGRARAALDGIDEIRRMVEQARGRIEVLPGGGITEHDVGRVVAATGVNQVHLSLGEQKEDSSARHNEAIRFGAELPTSELTYRATSLARVAQARRELD